MLKVFLLWLLFTLFTIELESLLMPSLLLDIVKGAFCLTIIDALRVLVLFLLTRNGGWQKLTGRILNLFVEMVLVSVADISFSRFLTQTLIGSACLLISVKLLTTQLVILSHSTNL